MRMRTAGIVAVALTLTTLVASAEAQRGRLRNRLFGGQRDSAPQVDRAKANSRLDGANRSSGQLREGLQRLGGELLDSGALESMLGQAGSPLPRLNHTAPKSLASRSQLKAQLGNGPEPFSPGWYSNHPHAWRFTHPHADAWAVASIGTAAAWLGIAATTPAESTATEQVHTSETLDPDAVAAADGDYLPLGVFALGPAGAQDPSALVQLAVTRDGELRGNYFDLVTSETQTLDGHVNKQTQLASFRLAAPKSAEFEATLVSLTRPDGSVRLRFGSGESRDWALARYEAEDQTKPEPALPKVPQSDLLTPPAPQ